MKEVEYSQFIREFSRFRKKHGGINKNVCEIVNNKTFNEFYFKDNFKWYEITENEYHTIETEIHGLNFIHKIVIIKTTYWHDEDSTQKITYRRG